MRTRRSRNRGRRNKQIGIDTIIIFVIAFLAVIAAVIFLPVSGEIKRLIFFTGIPVVAFLGVWLTSLWKKKH